MDSKPLVRTRFAPSPTGFLHLGSARTALFSYLYARQQKGEFVLRIEDTDKERSKPQYEKDILEGLEWLGISFDSLYRQSENISSHTKYLHQLIDSGHAYISSEESKNKDGVSEVIRFKNPNTKVSFQDEIRGEITFDTTELGDFIIAKNLETPLFHFAVVVDDFEESITHIIRGEDHISNTPRQILLQKALKVPTPKYAHIPLILGADKSKLSKRHGALSVNEYKEQGFLSAAMVNFLAMIGWNPGDDREIFTMEQLISEFSFNRIQRGGAVFNIDKLKWINKQHLQKISNEHIIDVFRDKMPQSLLKVGQRVEAMLPDITKIALERADFYGDFDTMINEGEFEFYFKEPVYETRKLLWKKETSIVKTKKHLQHLYDILSNLSNADWKNDIIKESIWDYADKEGRGNVLWPFRYSLSGRDKSPDPIRIATILGKEETLNRISYAIDLLGNEENS